MEPNLDRKKPLLPYPQEKILINFLCASEKFIVWALMELKGLDPLLFIHQIFLEENFISIKESIKEEIFRWLMPM